MKILMITQNFYPEIGSAGNRMKTIFLMLKQKGYHVDVLTTEPTYPSRDIYSQGDFWNEQDIDIDRNRVTRLSVQNKKYSSNFFSRLFYYLEIMLKMFFCVQKDKNQYDIVLVTSPPIFVAFVGLAAKYRYNAKLLLDIRDLWPESLKGVGVFNRSYIIWLFEKMESTLYKKADHIIINSEGFIDHFKNKCDGLTKKLIFLPNAARKKETMLEKREGGSMFNVVYAGNIGLAQDVTILMQLAKKLSEHHISLNVIGYGVQKQAFTDFVRRHNLKNVKLINPMGRQDCLNRMSRCDVGIATLNNSRVFETVLPGKIIDYLTCRLPVVASLSGYSKQLIENEKIGFVTSRQSVDEMVDYILKLYNDPALLEEMQSNCREFIEKKFLWENNINKLTNLLDKMAKG
ncbi:glycosyltransferase family 4 protein [Bacillus haynesii]|nr:glycosyltransferase family 4 protein [Bacillus haynesii]MEC0736473.1 glycosyltransferase family 4 protein [Bacillus haynesii]